MPIPHLSHKIHSPNNWKSNSSKRNNLKKKSPKKRGSFKIKFKKSKGKPFFDIKFNKKGPKTSFRQKLKKALPYILVIGLVMIIILVGGFAWLSKDLPEPGKLTERDIAQSTKIYDRTGEHLLYEIHGEQKRTIIALDDIPKYAIQATLALEDQKFYEHQGFNLWGIFRGVVLRTLTGKRAQGGSTLTQQLVKNAIVGDDRTITRKLKELVLAYQIEKKYSKDEILQMYFNEIPYGSTAYGIEAASTYYFAKSAKDLTLAEAAILAALPQAPSYYSPWGSHVDELYGRQQYAINQMVSEGYITQEEAEVAINEEITFANRVEGIEAPHFVFFVKNLLSEKYGEKLIEQGGFKIISTLDYDLQKKAEEIITEQAEKNLENYNASNAGLVAIDVETGQILAMVGSKDFFNDEIDGQVNITVANRQPGSSFKPIVYATAFNQGYVPETVVYDLETVFPTFDGDYVPHNYDLEEHGPVSLRKALAGSLNIPAVKLIHLAGISNVLDLADGLEYSTLKDRSRFGYSLVLGGGEVKLLEHTNAFATFARDGKKMRYAAVLSLEDNEGKVLEKYTRPYSQKVLEPNIARMVSNILSDNEARAYTFGESNYLTLGERPVAAKTGTTNDYHDAWTIGYTPQLAVGVWVGNNDNSEMKRGAAGGTVAAPIWNKVMREALKDKPTVEFTKPSYEIPDKPMLGGEATGVKVTIDKMSGLLATEVTPEHLKEEKLFKQAHNILYYVNINDPLGPIPQDPSQDELYSYWEEPVINWAEENGIANEEPPTEYDNLHYLSDKPSININQPKNNQTITEPEINVEINVSANKGIKKVEYYLNEQLLETAYNQPFDGNFIVPASILNGSYTLKAKVYDSVENVNESSVNITLDRESYLNVSWLEPSTGITIPASDFPILLAVNIDKIQEVQKIDFYYKPENSNNAEWINYVESPQANKIQTVWTSPPKIGVYKIYSIITTWGGYIITGPEITISLEE